MTQDRARSRRRVARLAAVGFLQLAATFVPARCLAADAVRPCRPPNVVLIVSDDQHWRDYGFMEHPHLRTPHLDRLARESLVFPRGYVTSSLCCPSLASIITGRYPHEHRIVGNDPPGGREGFAAGRERMCRHLEEWPTLPRLLATHGHTSFQAGKWWQGDFSRGGFTEGMTKGQRHGDEGLAIGRTTMQPIYDFIGRCREAEQPFFVWYAPMLPHDPHDPAPELVDHYSTKTDSVHVARYWGNVERFDRTVGDLLDHIDREGLAADTLVVYVTDNGWIQAADSPKFAARSKRSPYDGGLRTPMMLRQPGTVAPGVSDALASAIDIMPTILAACGAPQPAGLPGVNLLDPQAVAARRQVFGACFTHAIVDLDDPARSLLSRWTVCGDWKLIVPATDAARRANDHVRPESVPTHVELYDVVRDPDETTNLAADQPQVVTELTRDLDAWWHPAVAADEGCAIGLLTATRLTCEWLHEPAGVVARLPRLAWQVQSVERGGRQMAYRVLAASTAERLTPGAADLWDSGRVASSETLGAAYAGAPLRSGQQVFWRVQVWDGHDVAGPWSPIASWTMGVLDAADWQAEWISARDDAPLHADRTTLHLPPARQYRRGFRVAKPVKRALLHGTALGLVEWSLDGARIADHWFEPGWTDYRKRVPARTHDVTRFFTGKATDHCLAATVADGWYAGYVGYGLLVGYGPHRTGRAIYGKTPALRCRLDIEYADGSREAVVTDASWQVTAAGPIREADLIMGETHDARLEMPGWNTAGFVADGRWQPAIAAATKGPATAPFFEPGVEREVGLGFAPPTVAGYAAQPIRITQELPARNVKEQRPGVFVFDMGQNFAGVVRLKVAAPAGTRVGLRFGEMLHPDGRVMTENLRKARATDTYICRGGAGAEGSPPNGDGRETWTPRFTYHGFQYVEVSGLPAGSLPPLDTVTGLVLHNDMPLESSFACSDPVLTRFWENTRWTQRANFVEVPTDCPQRDERLGWMGDAQIYARTATFNGDVAAFFTKWLADVREAQADSGPHAGSYPDYCPYPFAHGQPGATFGTAWTDAGVICPWTMWRVYGDRRLLEEHWESMERFMAWRARLDPQLEGVQAGNPWGDWLNVGEKTPIAFIDICYHAQSARMMADMAAALGRDAEAAAYRRRFDALAASFARQHLRPDGTVAIDTQTACVLALDAGVVPEQHAGAVARQLAARIERNGFRMATGFLGTKPLLPVLSAHGHHDLACRLFQSRRFPSWGYEVEQGATSVWERWDSFTREHGFNGVGGTNNAAMNSFSHYAFGAVMEWAFRVLAGIDALEPGYGRILIRPRIPAVESNPDGEPLTWARADYASPRGPIRSHWQRRDGGLDMRVTIPANTTALVHVPAGADAVITEQDRLLVDGVPGVSVVSRDARETVLECGSGDYFFRAAAAAAPLPGEAVIRAPAGGSEIVITTTSRVAGAIHSLTWNGKEFIDSHDHGRQLQSASNFDVDGTFFDETFNPTEAGCERDMAGPTSTSRLLWLAAAGRECTTVNQMAFWLRPGQQSGGHPARNTTALSNHLLEKHVTIGVHGMPHPAREHAIRYEVAFTVPADERHTKGTFEALTGYMPAEFRTSHALAADGSLVPLDDGPGERLLPVILSTSDGGHAMGAWSPGRCHTTGRPASYGRFWFEEARVSKWNCVFRESAAEGDFLQPGMYRYLIWVAVGTREQVRDTLGILRRQATPDSH